MITIRWASATVLLICLAAGFTGARDWLLWFVSIAMFIAFCLTFRSGEPWAADLDDHPEALSRFDHLDGRRNPT